METDSNGPRMLKFMIGLRLQFCKAHTTLLLLGLQLIQAVEKLRELLP